MYIGSKNTALIEQEDIREKSNMADIQQSFRSCSEQTTMMLLHISPQSSLHQGGKLLMQELKRSEYKG